ncbi:MAG: hypothetical protein HYZ01_13605 [Ignavibacteriales bacterium]|nr:hypothetical protein [Ignavibacteriales bacterium]
MDFVLWVCRVMHVVSVVVWLGGLIFLNAILHPISAYHQQTKLVTVLEAQKRFLPFVWSSLWTVFVTGVLLMLLSPRFLWFEYSTTWSQLLAVKHVAFLLLMFFSWQSAKVVAKMGEAVVGEGDLFEGWRLGLQKLLRRSIAWGIVALMCAGGMAVV